MKRALAIVLALAPSVARAEEPPPPEMRHDPAPAADAPEFAPQSYLRILAGMGNAANLPMDDKGPSTTLGLEVGHYPLQGALPGRASPSLVDGGHARVLVES